MVWDLPSPGEAFGGVASHAGFRSIGDTESRGKGEGHVINPDPFVGGVAKEAFPKGQVIYIPLSECGIPVSFCLFLSVSQSIKEVASDRDDKPDVV